MTCETAQLRAARIDSAVSKAGPLQKARLLARVVIESTAEMPVRRHAFSSDLSGHPGTTNHHAVVA